MDGKYDLNDYLKPSAANESDENSNDPGYSSYDSEDYQEPSRTSLIESKKRSYSSDSDDEELSENDEEMPQIEDKVQTKSKDQNNPKTTSSKKQKIKPLTKEELLKYQKIEKKSGVVYMSRVPPFMKPNKVRRLLEQYGSVGKIYLAPEDPVLRKRRVKQGGSKRKGFVEGWIEFKDRKVAKAVAQMLNNQNIGGKKRSYHYEMLWNLKYLPKFKWRNLTEQLAFERVEREQRLKNEVSQARNEANDFIQKVEKAKAIKGMEAKKAIKASKNPQTSNSTPGNEITRKTQQDTLNSNNNKNRRIVQRSIIGATKSSTTVNNVLSKLL